MCCKVNMYILDAYFRQKQFLFMLEGSLLRDKESMHFQVNCPSINVKFGLMQEMLG